MKKLVFGAFMLAILLILVLILRGCNHPYIPQTDVPRLQPGEVAQVRYNARTHKLTTITPTKVETVYADNPIIHVAPGGYVLTETHPIGPRISPIIGMGYGDTGRVFIGLQVFHLWRFGINTSLGIAMDSKHVGIVPVTSLSYNIYGNLELFAGANILGMIKSAENPQNFIHGGVLVRFW